MFYKGKEVEYTDGRSAMEEFVAYLRSIPGPKLLVAHYGRKFDFPRIKRLLDLVGVVIPGNVVGCLDSLLLMRLLYPGEPSYKQGDLVSRFLGTGYEAHMALADVEALQNLVKHVRRQVAKQTWDENVRENLCHF